MTLQLSYNVLINRTIFNCS